MFLFKPTGYPPEVFTFNGATMSAPIEHNANTINSARVYFIFVGSSWKIDGIPIPAIATMISRAKEFFGSPYLTGLHQYGCDGVATFVDYTIDTSLDPVTWTHKYVFPDGSSEVTNNPVWFETDAILANSQFAGWRPPAGDARTSPIYVVARYSNSALGTAGGYGGSNGNGPNKYTNNSVNVVDISLSSADQVDEFTWLLSHELVERMSTGIGGLSSSSGQIADGEPEEPQFYGLGPIGLGSAVVTSYWSFLDQAFIIPDGILQRILLLPIWSANSWSGKCVALTQGTLNALSPPGNLLPIDTKIQSFVLNPPSLQMQIFTLNSNGEVKTNVDGGTAWTALTGANTSASSIVTTSDGSLYMVATNASASGGTGVPQIWRYDGSGASWTPLTDATITEIAGLAVSDKYVFTSCVKRGIRVVQKYSNDVGTWINVTGNNTFPSLVVATAGTVYMIGSNDGNHNRVWRYTGVGDSWVPITGINTTAYGIVAFGDVLCMMAENQGDGTASIWQYGLDGDSWIRLIDANKRPSGMSVQDGSNLYTIVKPDSGNAQVWQYNGTPGDWVALTGSNTNVESIKISSYNKIYMFAANDGGPIKQWVYDGVPGQWTPVKSS
jgi:hypothetical protein